MSFKMYVGNLSYGVQESHLEELFKSSGAIVSVKIIRDMDTGRSKGFGFVEMENEDELKAAISQFNGHELEGRALKLDEARPPQKREGRGGGGGGGYRRGGGGGGGGNRGGGRSFGGGNRY